MSINNSLSGGGDLENPGLIDPCKVIFPKISLKKAIIP